MALKSPEIRVVGITVVAGNGVLTNMAANVMRCLSVLPPEQHNIPVHKGLDRPLLGHFRKLDRATSVHGLDGLDDRSDLTPTRLLDSEVNAACSDVHAAQAIIDYSHTASARQ